ncbi:MAG: hypothetical protein ACFCVH_17815 [Alphaproteobacteria bacterium]
MAVLLLSTDSPAFASDPPPTDCDRLAAEPGMVAGVPGVTLEAIEPGRAMAACEQAVRDHPGVPRFVHQYARALQRSGNADAAATLYEWAAGDGLAASQYALGRMLQAGDGVPADPAAAARWLEAAAAQGHAAAADALASPTPPAAPPAGSASETEAYALADSVEGIAAVLDAIWRDAPRTRFDPLAVLQPAGVSIEALTAWVEREVALVPYRGSLRGARGTLMDRYGNSLDRSLLLAELLVQAGYDARLARGTLDQATAVALLDAFAPPPGDEPPAGDRNVLASRVAAAAGPYADAWTAELSRADQAEQTLEAEVRQRSAALSQDLLSVLADLPRQPGEGEALAMADHWWVQVRDGDDWVDADPSAAIVGSPMAQEAMAPADLPDELRHRVELRLVVEFWEDGLLRQETLLTHDLVPAALIDRPVMLRHVPLSGPRAQALMDREGEDVVAATLDAAAAAWVWQPVLVVGDEAAVDHLFTTGGEVLPSGPESLRELGVDDSLFGDLAGQIGSVFDDVPAPLPPTAPDEATAPVRVTAEWLEFEIHVPGEAPTVHRRTVFDLLGPEARSTVPVPAPTVGAAEQLQRALGLLREVDILVTGAAPAESFVQATMARDGADLMRILAPLLRLEDADPLAPAENVPRIQLPLYRHALLRQDNSEPGRRPYLDRPNVALTWTGFAGTGPADLRATRLFDIVANGVSAPTPEDPFSARLAQGVRDTVAEDALAGPGPTGNTAALYEADRAAGRDWVRLSPGGTDALVALDLPAEAKSAIAEELAGGALVLVPPSPVATAAGPQVAWWRVDPVTGATLGMSPAGGAAMTERAMLLAQGVEVGGCFVLLGMAISGGYGGVAVGAALCIAGGVTAGVAIVDGAGLPAMIGAATALGGVVAAAVSAY